MSYQWEGIQPETFAQANPFLAGLSNAWQTMGQYGQMQQQLAQGQIQGAQAQYAQPSALAALQNAQAQPALTRAQTTEANAQAAYMQLGLTPEAAAQAGYISGAQTQEALGSAAQSQGAARVSNVEAGNPALLAGGNVAQLYGLNSLLANSGNQGQGVPGVPAGTPSGQSPNGYQKIPGGLTGWPTVPPPPGGGNPLSPAIQQNNQPQIAKSMAMLQQMNANAAGYVANATTNIADWRAAQDDAANKSNNAAQMQQNLNKFHANYLASSLKGAFEGEIPSNWSGKIAKSVLDQNGDISAEQNADQASKNLAANFANTLQPQTTVEGLKISPLLKPSRLLDPDAEAASVDSMQAYINRQQEYQTFMNTARQRGMENPQVAKTLWNQYQVDRPAVDPTTGTINKQYQNTWPDYLTPQAMQQATAGQRATVTPVAADLKKYGAMNAPSAPPVQMPTFNNQQEFQSWYGQQPPAQQAAIRKQLGGQ